MTLVEVLLVAVAFWFIFKLLDRWGIWCAIIGHFWRTEMTNSAFVRSCNRCGHVVIESFIRRGQ